MKVYDIYVINHFFFFPFFPFFFFFFFFFFFRFFNNFLNSSIFYLLANTPNSIKRAGLFPSFITLINLEAESLYNPFPSKLTYINVVLLYNVYSITPTTSY